MGFTLLIMVMLVLILLAINPRSFGNWTRGSWIDLFAKGFRRSGSDLEIRADFREREYMHIPHTGVEAVLIYPDPILDRLIYEERFEEANHYRMTKVVAARESRNDEDLRTYSIYRNLIANAHAARDNAHRATIKTRYAAAKEELRKKDPTYEKQENQVDPMALPDELNPPVEPDDSRISFLEVPHTTASRRAPIDEAPIPQQVRDSYSPSSKDENPPEAESVNNTLDENDEYEGLISV